MKRIVLFGMALLCIVGMNAQDRFYYSGPQLCIAKNQFTCVSVGKLDGAADLNYQGMDCWNEYIVSLQNEGMATTYKYDGMTVAKIGTFKLGSYGDKNTAKVASFSNQFFSREDKMPLLFVSQSHNEAAGGQKDVIFVERISTNMKSSKLVAKIQFKEANKLFGNTLQWVVDKENKFLYGFGNTIDDSNASNKHRLVKFKLPTIAVKAKGKNIPTINLSEKDLLENYLIEDYCPMFNSMANHGLMVKYGLLYMPVGKGTSSQPSTMCVWNLAKRKLQNSIDMSTSTTGELTDCAECMGELLIQSQDSIYKLRFE